jgi:hypothetical protein
MAAETHTTIHTIDSSPIGTIVAHRFVSRTMMLSSENWDAHATPLPSSAAPVAIEYKLHWTGSSVGDSDEDAWVSRSLLCSSWRGTTLVRGYDHDHAAQLELLQLS